MSAKNLTDKKPFFSFVNNCYSYWPYLTKIHAKVDGMNENSILKNMNLNKNYYFSNYYPSWHDVPASSSLPYLT
jgi:hypothetical protein